MALAFLRPVLARANVLARAYLNYISSNYISPCSLSDEKLRPYKCAFCDRAFGKKSNCQKHEKLHTGQKYAQRVSTTNSRESIQMPHVSRGNVQFAKPVAQRSQAVPPKANNPSSPAGIASFFGEFRD